MSRHRFALAALFAGLLLVPCLTASAQFEIGNFELGDIDSLCVAICADETCQNSPTVESLEIAPPFFVRGIRVNDADKACNDPTGSTGVTLPVTPPNGKLLYFDLMTVATEVGTFPRAFFFNGTEFGGFQANVAPALPCPASDPTALCLQDDRFTVRTFWRTQFGTRGDAPFVQGVPSDDSGLLFFFNPNNWEILLKVLDGCPVNNHFWVFAAATTNVEYTITVTDTQADTVKTYFNPLGQPAAAIQDTNAFFTCP